MENQILKEEEVLTLLKNKVNSLLEQGEEIIKCPNLIGFSYRIGEVCSTATCDTPTWVNYYLKVKEADYNSIYSENLSKEVFHFIKGKLDDKEELRKIKEVIESLEYLKE